jgi:hypothetical protein
MSIPPTSNLSCRPDDISLWLIKRHFIMPRSTPEGHRTGYPPNLRLVFPGAGMDVAGKKNVGHLQGIEP